MSDGPRVTLMLVTCLSAASCAVDSKNAANSTPPVSRPYFGQPVPGLVPALFAPGIIDTDAIEFNGVFSPDGREFFFGRHVAGVDTMFHSVFADGAWSEPVRLAAFPGTVCGDMAVSPDGRDLYFLGEYPNP